MFAERGWLADNLENPSDSSRWIELATAWKGSVEALRKAQAFSARAKCLLLLLEVVMSFFNTPVALLIVGAVGSR